MKKLKLRLKPKLYATFFALIFGQMLWQPVQAQRLTLDSCQALARQNYPLVKQYDLIEKAKDYTLSNASKAYLPHVSVTGILGYVFAAGQNEAKLIGIAQLNQTIWDGGATKAQKEIIAANADAEVANLEVTLFELQQRVNQLFFGVLMVDAQLDQIAQHQKVLANNADRVAKMKDNGLAYSTDLDEISVEQRKLDQRKTEFVFARQGYLEMLSLLTGVLLNEQTELVKPEMQSVSLDMPNIRPELDFFESQRKLVNAQDAMRKVSLMPKIGLLGVGVFLSPEIALGPASFGNLGVFGLNAAWDIGGLYRNGNQKKLTELALQKVDLMQENFLFNNKLQTRQTNANIAKQQAILKADEEIVALQKRISAGYQLKHENGMCSMLDLLDANEKASEANTQQQLHEMQLLISLYELKNQTGN